MNADETFRRRSQRHEKTLTTESDVQTRTRALEDISDKQYHSECAEEENSQQKLWTSQFCSSRISEGKPIRPAKCATRDTVKAANDTAEVTSFFF